MNGSPLPQEIPRMNRVAPALVEMTRRATRSDSSGTVVIPSPDGSQVPLYKNEKDLIIVYEYEIGMTVFFCLCLVVFRKYYESYFLLFPLFLIETRPLVQIGMMILGKKKKSSQRIVCVSVRVGIKIAMGIFGIVCLAKGSRDIIYIAMVPLIVYYIASFFIYTNINKSNQIWKAYSSLYKFTRIVASLVLIFALKKPPNREEFCLDSYWGAYCFLLFMIPLFVFILFYTVFFKISDCIMGNFKEKVRPYLLGNLWSFLLMVSCLYNGLRILISSCYQFDLKINHKIDSVLGITAANFAVLFALCFLLKKSILFQLNSNLEGMNESSDDENGDQGQNNDADDPNISSNNLLGRNTFAIPPGADEENKSAKSSKNINNSNPSFNFVAKKNSIMFVNLGKEDLKNYSELDKSILESQLLCFGAKSRLKFSRNFEMEPLDFQPNRLQQVAKSPLLMKAINEGGCMKVIEEVEQGGLAKSEVYSLKSACLQNKNKKKRKRKGSFSPDMDDRGERIRGALPNFDNVGFNLEEKVRPFDQRHSSYNAKRNPGHQPKSPSSYGSKHDSGKSTGSPQRRAREALRFDSEVNLSNVGRLNDSPGTHNAGINDKGTSLEKLPQLDNLEFESQNLEVEEPGSSQSVLESISPEDDIQTLSRENERQKEDEEAKSIKDPENTSINPSKELDNVSQKKRKERLERLIQKNKKRSEEKKLCIICMDNDPDSIFYKCGHGGFCFECAKTIIETHTDCHYCRQEVIKVLKIDTSHHYKDVYKVLEVFKVLSVEGSDVGENEEDLDYISFG